MGRCSTGKLNCTSYIVKLRSLSRQYHLPSACIMHPSVKVGCFSNSDAYKIGWKLLIFKLWKHTVLSGLDVGVRFYYLLT